MLTTTTEYLPGFQTRVTNPRGFQTHTTQYQVFDQPSYDRPTGINHPEGQFTEIYRDVFGKTTALRRRNGDGSQSVWRNYIYDPYQQLCKTIEPETGATVVDYDAAGNLAWSASGLTGGNYGMGNTCSRSEAYASGRRADRTYDVRNRVKTLNFPDGLGNQTWSYTPDGLPSQITANNAFKQAGNTYAYNKRRLLTGESIGQTGWYTWGAGYGYDNNGNLSSQVYPDGFTLNYFPNALGQPTQVRDTTGKAYATGISYYPNGALNQFTYGNGIVHTLTQNARQLPLRSTDSGGAMDYQYHYDANGNPEVIYQADALPNYHVNHRWLQYDGLDRLTAAGAGMFGGDNWHRFTYDALDNLKSWKLGGVKDYANYVYDPYTNRLTNIQNSAGSTVVGLGYDAQGNLANKNGQAYSFDFGNRLRQAPGAVNYNYDYDGHGRRIQAWKPNVGGILSMYGHNGQLLYDEDSRNGAGLSNIYIYLQGSLLAHRERPYSTTNIPAVKYQHTDALGSPVAVSNEAGQVIDRTNWEPFG